jgi:tetratricopeptide (TPR) repeat protein
MKTLIYILIFFSQILSVNLSISEEYFEPKKSFSGSYLSALHARSNNDSSSASKFFEQTLKFDPYNENLIFQTFVQKLMTGEVEAAYLISKRLNNNRDLTLVYLVNSIIEYKKGNFFQAQKEVDKIKNESMVGFSLPLLRAWSRVPIEDYKYTFKALNPYTEQEEWLTIYNINCGMLNEYFKKKKEALDCYREVSKNINDQPLYFLKIVVDALVRLNRKNEAQGLIKNFKLQRSFSPLLNHFLDEYSLNLEPQKISERIGFAETMRTTMHLQMSMNRNNPGILSLIYAQLALYLNTDLTLLKYDLANILRNRGQYQSANKILNTVELENPGYAMSQLRIAENLVVDKKLEKAISVLISLSEKETELSSPLISLGDIYRSEGEFLKAIDFYNKAFNSYQKGDTQHWSLYYSRGIAFERAMQWDLAEKDFKKSLALNPDEPEVLNYLGYSWLDQGKNIEQARDMIQLAAKKRPKDGYIIDSLGWSMFLMGEYENAVSYLEKAVSLRPADTTINEHLGDAYWQVGRKTEAIFQWNHALITNKEKEREILIKDKIKNGFR